MEFGVGILVGLLVGAFLTGLVSQARKDERVWLEQEAATQANKARKARKDSKE